MPEFFRHQTTDVRVFLDIDSFQRGSGFRPDVVTIGAIYTHRMEFGPRALGARAILANPARRETHDLLITRLEGSE
ncbi:MAG: carbamoyltransferase C-terminal domain-containing protein, partial [Pseudolabrys sp.]